VRPNEKRKTLVIGLKYHIWLQGTAPENVDDLLQENLEYEIPHILSSPKELEQII
jgi:hypothetical protein